MRYTSAATPGAPRTPGEEPPMTHNYLIFTDPHRCPRRRRRHPRLVGLAGSDCHRRRLVHRPGSGGRGTLAVAGCPTRHAGRSRLPATSPTESSMRCRRRNPLRPRPTNARARLALRLGAVAVQGGGLPRRINDHTPRRAHAAVICTAALITSPRPPPSARLSASPTSRRSACAESTQTRHFGRRRWTSLLKRRLTPPVWCHGNALPAHLGLTTGHMRAGQFDRN